MENSVVPRKPSVNEVPFTEKLVQELELSTQEEFDSDECSATPVESNPCSDVPTGCDREKSISGSPTLELRNLRRSRSSAYIADQESKTILQDGLDPSLYAWGPREVASNQPPHTDRSSQVLQSPGRALPRAPSGRAPSHSLAPLPSSLRDRPECLGSPLSEYQLSNAESDSDVSLFNARHRGQSFTNLGQTLADKSPCTWCCGEDDDDDFDFGMLRRLLITVINVHLLLWNSIMMFVTVPLRFVSYAIDWVCGGQSQGRYDSLLADRSQQVLRAPHVPVVAGSFSGPTSYEIYAASAACHCHSHLRSANDATPQTVHHSQRHLTLQAHLSATPSCPASYSQARTEPECRASRANDALSCCSPHGSDDSSASSEALSPRVELLQLAQRQQRNWMMQQAALAESAEGKAQSSRGRYQLSETLPPGQPPEVVVAGHNQAWREARLREFPELQHRTPRRLRRAHGHADESSVERKTASPEGENASESAECPTPLAARTIPAALLFEAESVNEFASPRASESEPRRRAHSRRRSHGREHTSVNNPHIYYAAIPSPSELMRRSGHFSRLLRQYERFRRSRRTPVHAEDQHQLQTLTSTVIPSHENTSEPPETTAREHSCQSVSRELTSPSLGRTHGVLQGYPIVFPSLREYLFVLISVYAASGFKLLIRLRNLVFALFTCKAYFEATRIALTLSWFVFKKFVAIALFPWRSSKRILGLFIFLCCARNPREKRRASTVRVVPRETSDATN